MHRLPLVQNVRVAFEPPAATEETGSLPGRFGLADYAVYSGKLAVGIVASRIAKRHAPLMVNIEPTHRCNLDCVYCDKVDPRSPQMETEAALRMIDELAEMGTLSVCFDGGEPLVHPGMERFVHRAKFHGMRVSMSTNGLLIARKRAILDSIDLVKISIDGPESVHDAGRGSGAYAKALEGARLAVEAGCSVALRMTLAEHNAMHFEEVLAAAKELGVAALFQPAIGNIMNGSDAPAPHSPAVVAYRAAIDALKELKRAGEPVANERFALEHLRHWPDPKPVPYCAGGRIEVAIGPDGGMFPCGRTGRGEPAPNVFELGVRRAFERVMRPTDCANCWCTLTYSGCYLYRGDVLRLLTRR
ncbi:MAG TPA: radical SAM protein [Polyangiaceae bacterium]|nr:radical SAM protein [Polyangiaceae bacterium]